MKTRNPVFAFWEILHPFLSSTDFFQNQLFRKILSGIPSEYENSLDPDPFVGPDVGPYCLQRLTSRYRVKLQILIAIVSGLQFLLILTFSTS